MENPQPIWLSREEAREVDRLAIEEYGISGVVLMENAARNCVDLLETIGIGLGVVIVCGKGNNGGDGFAMARHLLVREIPFQVVMTCEPAQLAGDALVNWEILNRLSPHSIVQFGESLMENLDKSFQSDWVVDALLGTGVEGALRGPYANWIGQINQLSQRKMAVDLPSGMDANSGDSLGAIVEADTTVTFVGMKTGFRNPAAGKYLGNIHVVDIGFPFAGDSTTR